MLAGSFGTLLHVLLDSPLYGDIRPLYPLTVNPFYNPALTGVAYFSCIVAGGIGVFLYFSMLFIPMVVRYLKKLK